MANLLNQEPRAFGLINFKTNFGDIDIELFTQQCPKATRNFVQLCLDGFYKGTIFERVEKDFIAIGGCRPDEEEGDEEDEDFFPDEFHSRLRFTRRGLLATANTNKDANASRFFFTLGATPELQNKHTIFGRVKGNTVYSLVDLNECQTDDDNCPFSEKKILDVSVVENPYPELKPRLYRQLNYNKQIESDEADGEGENPLAGPKTDLTCSNKKLFYPDEEEDEECDEDGYDKGKYRPIVEKPKSVEEVKTIDEKLPKHEESSEDNISLRNSEQSQSTDVVENVEAQSEQVELFESKEQKLLRLKAEFEAIKKQLESSQEIKTLSDRRNDSRDKSMESNRSSVQSDGDKKAPLNMVSRKNKDRALETLDKLENFKKKLKLASEKGVRSCKPIDKLQTSPHSNDELASDLIDDESWLNHKFVADDNSETRMAKDASTKDESFILFRSVTSYDF